MSSTGSPRGDLLPIARLLTGVSLVVGVASCAGMAGPVNYSLGHVPPGSEVRPMALAFWAMLLAVAAFLVGVSTALSAAGLWIAQKRPCWALLPLAALVLCLMPFPIFTWLVGVVVKSRNLQMLP